MLICFKGWVQRIVVAFLIGIISVPTCAQESKLQSEIDINSGLPSNAVRCLKLDDEHRLWVGTDNGLGIFEANTDIQKKIINTVGNKSIWSIELLDSFVMIGTRYDGLYIFNRNTARLSFYYSNKTINLIRKIKVIGKRIFVLTNTDPFEWYYGKILTRLYSKKKYTDGFLLDLFEYDHEIYGFANTPNILLLKGNRFEKNVSSEILKYQKGGEESSHFSSTIYHNNILIGGSMEDNTKMPLSLLNPKRNIVTEQQPFCNKTGQVWDIAITDNKIIAAIGDAKNNVEGYLYITNNNLKNEPLIASCYLTCLVIDSTLNTIYIGSLNRGIIVMKGISGTNAIIVPNSSDFISFRNRYLFSNNRELIVYNEGRKVLYQKTLEGLDKQFNSINVIGDTLIYSTQAYNYYVDLKNGRDIKGLFKKLYHSGSKIMYILLNKSIYSFPTYGGCYQYSIDSNMSKELRNYQNFLPFPKIEGNNIVVLNKEKGFGIVTNKDAFNLNCTDNNVAFITDFSVLKDTVYGLTNHSVKQYGIDYKAHNLKPLKTYAIDSCIQGFLPEWIFNYHKNLYVANKHGILRLNTNDGKPLSYYYLGNYAALNEPKIDGDSLVWAASGYITKVAINEIDQTEFAIKTNSLTMHFAKDINELIAFKVAVNCPNYLMQEHSLKTLAIWKDGYKVGVRYTVGNGFEFSNGLPYGNYELLLTVGNNTIKSKLAIGLPMNRNPYFFGSILLLMLVIVGVVLKMQLDKRSLNKKLLQNRLHVLKQNMNPHFVYNSMNMISSLILEKKYTDAVQVTADFSNLQRTYLETNNKEHITLTEELAFLKAYLGLQHRRFYMDKNFEYFIAIEEGIDTEKIILPPLILQPIAENAIKYGVVGSSALDKKIHISITGKNSVIIALEDNGELDMLYPKGQGLGQKLVEERIELFANFNKCVIEVEFGMPAEYSERGYRVEVRII